MMLTHPNALLDCRGVSRWFGGHLALNQVDIVVEAGTVTGLIGPNGAGKTTLFNLITGLLEPSSGRVLLDGADISAIPPYKRARLGVARTFQRLELFTSMTVRENIRTAGEIRNTWRQGRNNPNQEADRIIELIGVGHVADREIAEIPTGMARRVELGRALMTRPKLLLLDEPASGQTEQETEEFGQLLLALAGEGIGILLVEHDVSLVMRTCSFLYVLDFGLIISSGSPDQVKRDPRVLSAYLGADHASDEAKP